MIITLKHNYDFLFSLQKLIYLPRGLRTNLKEKTRLKLKNKKLTIFKKNYQSFSIFEKMGFENGNIF